MGKHFAEPDIKYWRDKINTIVLNWHKNGKEMGEYSMSICTNIMEIQISQQSFLCWWLVGVTLVVAFGFLPKNFGRLLGAWQWYLMILLFFYECSLNVVGSQRRRRHSNPTCCKKLTSCTYRWWGQKTLGVAPARLALSMGTNEPPGGISTT